MRPSWDEYFMEMAQLVAKRSTCMRRQVGAVIVLENRVLSSGYNGSPKGTKHCEDVGCLREQMKIPSGERHELCRAVHAEQNAIVQAAAHGTAINGATIYITHSPCVLCTKMLINAGIKKIVSSQDYNDNLAIELLKETGIIVEKMQHNNLR